MLRRLLMILFCLILLLQSGLGFWVSVRWPLRIQEAVAQTGRRQVICLMVKDILYWPLEDRLLRWKQDKERLGAEVLVKRVSDESPSVIRSFLKNITDLVGCLMVGDIPYVEFEWTYSDIDGKQQYDRFPSDHYFMDLNGDWIDSDRNGIYDKILGEMGPEIWVGRLKASNLYGNEIDILKRYFDKNHDYLTGALTMPSRALLYVDESTPGAQDDVTNYYTGALALKTEESLSRLYPEVVVVRSPRYTNSTDYLARLREPWNLARLIVHSGGFGHHFIYDGQWDGKVYPLDIRNVDPKCFFYLITSCNNFDYRKRDYMGAWYVFGTYGLLAIGDSSVRDILVVLPEIFFYTLKDDCFGNAYLRWARECVIQGRNAINIINYAMIGDPSLGITPSQPIPEFSRAVPLMTSVFAVVLIMTYANNRRSKERREGSGA